MSRLQDEVNDCVDQARHHGYDGDSRDYELTEADVLSIIEALGYKPTRLEWAEVGCANIGDQHCG